MTKVLLIIGLLLFLTFPVSAAEITAPEVPEAGMDLMPDPEASFGDGLLELLEKALGLLEPELKAALEVSTGILFSALVLSVLPALSEKMQDTTGIAAAVIMGTLLFQRTGTMIRLAVDGVSEICGYGKLLCPVMTMALAAQGGITGSAALYAGTTLFLSVLSMLITGWMVPLVYAYLVLSVSSCAIGEAFLRNLADAIKRLLTWLLKTVLLVFTTYLSITGIVSGTADAAALKAAKVTISTAVPVVGGILSEASQSVLASMAVMKNAAGIYGILAVLAVFAGPFVKVGVQYMLLKATSVLCGIFGEKKVSDLVEDFSSAMGLLVAMVAASCVLVLISTVCFLRGTGA